MTTLYLVPTPLGDPDDITLRALRILREASAIALPDAPDQNLTLLGHWEIRTPTLPYSHVLDALNAGDVALVSDYGTPAIGGAGHEVVRAALDHGIKVEPLPGASAEITALVLSGLPTDSFVYVGELPDDLSAYADERSTMIFRMPVTSERLDKLHQVFGGERPVCTAAGLTSADEIIFRGDLDGAVEYFMDVLYMVLMDGVVIVAGAPPKAAEVWDEARVRAALVAKLDGGEPLKLAAKAVAAAAGWDRRTVYALGVDQKRNTP